MLSEKDRLLEVISEELDAFTSDSRNDYLEAAKKLGVTAKVDEAVVVIGNEPAPKYVASCTELLQKYKVVLLAASGRNLQKLVAVAEQIKHASNSQIAQFNKVSTQPSLINPAYRAEQSMKNVQVFFGDDTASQSDTPSQSDSASAALREIRGHKVYDVPCLRIILAQNTDIPANGLSGWSLQKS
ncbi:hypothetical protein E0198_004355 [Clavispora lusitaniae]|nr:hypothetical protein E0198_004355 [Clavispora lusitaniae]